MYVILTFNDFEGVSTPKFFMKTWLEKKYSKRFRNSSSFILYAVLKDFSETRKAQIKFNSGPSLTVFWPVEIS